MVHGDYQKRKPSKLYYDPVSMMADYLRRRRKRMRRPIPTLFMRLEIAERFCKIKGLK